MYNNDSRNQFDKIITTTSITKKRKKENIDIFERGGRGQGQLVRCLPNKSKWESGAEDVEVERNLWFKIATHTGNSPHAWQLAGRQEAKK